MTENKTRQLKVVKTDNKIGKISLQLFLTQPLNYIILALFHSTPHVHAAKCTAYQEMFLAVFYGAGSCFTVCCVNILIASLRKYWRNLGCYPSSAAWAARETLCDLLLNSEYGTRRSLMTLMY